MFYEINIGTRYLRLLQQKLNVSNDQMAFLLPLPMRLRLLLPEMTIKFNAITREWRLHNVFGVQNGLGVERGVSPGRAVEVELQNGG